MLLGQGEVEKKRRERERYKHTPPRQGCPRPQSAARTRLKSTHYSLRHIKWGMQVHSVTTQSHIVVIIVCM